MKATQQLNELGQSLWLDNITRDLLDSGTLKRYIDELSVTGLTSNPTIFDHAMTHSNSYDGEIRQADGARADRRRRILRDGDRRPAPRRRLVRADSPAHRDRGRLGVAGGLAAAGLRREDDRGSREDAAPEGRPPQFVHQDSRHQGGPPAIEEAIFAGVSVNVTLLFTREHYLGAADAYMRGLERRVDAGLSPDVRSVASLFVSRWDKATMDKVPAELRDKLGPAIGQQAYKAYRDVLESRPLAAAGEHGRACRSGCSSPAPEPRIRRRPTCSTSARWLRPTRSTPCRRRRLLAFGEHGEVGGAIPRDGGDCEQVLAAFGKSRNRRGKAGRRFAIRGRQVLRRFLAGSVEVDRVQEQSAEVINPENTSNDPVRPIETPAWRACKRTTKRSRTCICGKLFADDPQRGDTATAEGAGLYLDYSKNRVTDETMRLLLQLATRARRGRAARCHVPRREDQHHRKARRAARRSARSAWHEDRSRRQGRRRRGARRARQDGGLLRPRAQRRMEGPYRQAHQERDQHRHRRLVSGAGDGLRRAARLHRSAR